MKILKLIMFFFFGDSLSLNINRKLFTTQTIVKNVFVVYTLMFLHEPLNVLKYKHIYIKM